MAKKLLLKAEEARKQTKTLSEYYDTQRESYFGLLNEQIQTQAKRAYSQLVFRKGMFSPEMINYFKPELESLGYKVILENEEFILSWSDNEKLSS